MRKLSTGAAIEAGLNVVASGSDELLKEEMLSVLNYCGIEPSDEELAGYMGLHSAKRPVFFPIAGHSEARSEYPFAVSWDFSNNQPVSEAHEATLATIEVDTMKGLMIDNVVRNPKGRVGVITKFSKGSKATGPVAYVLMDDNGATESIMLSKLTLVAANYADYLEGKLVQETKSVETTVEPSVKEDSRPQDVKATKSNKSKKSEDANMAKNAKVENKVVKTKAAEKENWVAPNVAAQAPVDNIDVKALLAGKKDKYVAKKEDKVPQGAPATQGTATEHVVTPGKKRLKKEYKDAKGSSTRDSFWYRKVEGVDLTKGSILENGSIEFEEAQFNISKIMVWDRKETDHNNIICHVWLRLENGVVLKGFKVWNSQFSDGSIYMTEAQFKYTTKDNEEKWTGHIDIKDAKGMVALVLCSIECLLEDEDGYDSVEEDDEDEE